MKKLLLILMCLCILGACGMESKAQKEYKQAQQLENSENLERALDIYENILAIYPTTKTAGQIKNLNKTEEIANKIASTQYNDAMELAGKGELESSIESLQHLISKYPYTKIIPQASERLSYYTEQHKQITLSLEEINKLLENKNYEQVLSKCSELLTSPQSSQIMSAVDNLKTQAQAGLREFTEKNIKRWILKVSKTGKGEFGTAAATAYYWIYERKIPIKCQEIGVKSLKGTTNQMHCWGKTKSSQLHIIPSLHKPNVIQLDFMLAEPVNSQGEIIFSPSGSFSFFLNLDNDYISSSPMIDTTDMRRYYTPFGDEWYYYKWPKYPKK